jgi:hypothetical protein
MASDCSPAQARVLPVTPSLSRLLPAHLKHPGLLIGSWACFLAWAFFYAAVLPMWEGYDEWSHFAYINHVVAHNEMPRAAETRVSREIESSLRVVPLPWAASAFTPSAIRQDDYWNAPERDRTRRTQELNSIPRAWQGEIAVDGPLLYEAQQPPLYYWLMSIPLRLAGDAPLPGRVCLIRYLSVALASLSIPIAFFAARQIFGQEQLALGVAALMAALPELMIDICRVGNESLAILLFSLLTFLLLRYLDPNAKPPTFSYSKPLPALASSQRHTS